MNEEAAGHEQAEGRTVEEMRRVNAATKAELAGRTEALRRAEAQLRDALTILERQPKPPTDSMLALERQLGDLRQEHERLLNSLSWRMTASLRLLRYRHPRLVRHVAAGVRLMLWAVTLQWRQIRRSVRWRRELRRQERLVGGDPMFDEGHYVTQVTGAGLAGWSPVRHYLLLGRHQGLTAHPLFDPAWYRAAYTDIGNTDPLVHYIGCGRKQGRRPNEFFDPAWYRQQYPAAAGQDPVLHYLQAGAALNYDPGPQFRTAHYVARYTDIAGSGMNPLHHYLVRGLPEKRRLPAWDVDLRRGLPVGQAAIECRKRPGVAREAALFVTHSPDGRLKPYVRHYLEALHREGIATTLIVAADRDFTEDEPWLTTLLAGLYVRANQGWDFACWAHALRLNQQFYRSDVLYWLNDSLIGPVDALAFRRVLDRVRGHPAALVSLTNSHERGQIHLQSFFLAFKPAALRSITLHAFVRGIRSFPDKNDAINAYEIPLSARLAESGLSVAALFEAEGSRNPAVFEWKRLLDAGMPFLKILAITHDSPHVDRTGWREALGRCGYDVALADRLLMETSGLPPARLCAVAKLAAVANDPVQVAFIAPISHPGRLGVAARGYAAALMHAGLSVNTLPVSLPARFGRSVVPPMPGAECLGPADVALVFLNPDAWRTSLDAAQAAVVATAYRRVGLFAWESQLPPPAYTGLSRRLDEVWVPSRAAAHAFAGRSAVPVRVIPCPLTLAAPLPNARRAARLRQALGIGAVDGIVLCRLDGEKSLLRENPHALVRSFARSGLAATGWRLVLQTPRLAEGPDGLALAEQVAHTPGAQILAQALDADAASALLDVADVYVSPHAACWFSHAIVEAMALGKPVVASDTGGSTDILDASCGFPVPCRDGLLDWPEAPWPAGTRWGWVDEEALAQTLVRVACLHSDARAEIGREARRRVENRLSPAAIGALMRQAVDDLP